MTNPKRIKSVFANIPGLVTLVLVAIHQSIIAISAIFLTNAIKSFQSGDAYGEYLTYYFISMATPYIPGCLSYIALQAWINRSHHNYINNVIEIFSQTINIYRNLDLKQSLESAAARSSFLIIKDSLLFTHGFVSFFLNSSLSLLVIGIILPGNIFTGYIASLVICTFIIIVSSRTLGRAAFKSETSFKGYTNILSKIWPNITLNNKLNSAAWAMLYNRSSKNYYRDKISFETRKQLANLTLSVFSLIPTIYLIYTAVRNPTEPGLIAAVIVNLTRIFHILSSLNSLISDSLEWPAIHAKLKILFDFRFSHMTDAGKITHDKIKINNETIENLPDKIQELEEKSAGRFTVRGSNGAGKSTLLLVLKDKLGDGAVYMPSNHDDLVWTTEIAGELSTGQRTIEALRRIFDEEDATHILLDEWDANLDAENTRAVDHLIQEAAKTRVVIEVRH